MALTRLNKGEAIWTLHPNGTGIGGIAVPLEDADGYIAKGWIMVNGERAKIAQRVLPDSPYLAFLRIHFDEPYPHRHP